jgi:hypothetical protein
MATPEIEDLRILEIGQVGLFRTYFPTQTHFFDTSNGTGRTAGARRPTDPDSLLTLGRLLHSGNFDLIVCAPASHSPWHWQTLARTIFDRRVVSNLRRPLRQFGPQLLRFQQRTPLAVVDFADTAYIERSNFFLLDRARLYFKRELPADEWKLLTKTASGTQPTARIRRQARFRDRLAKLRPLPLGVPAGGEAFVPTDIPPKRTDIFFAGTVEGMPVRERALKELATLRDEGFVIDIPDQPIPRPEFYRRCAQAWLTLSPEGYGWDCFRHYEAAACGSVPLINRPSIRRHAPLLDGEHVLFFELEPGFLAARARQALADKGRLAAMAAAGRAHVLANHTMEPILRYVVSTTLAEIDLPA